MYPEIFIGLLGGLLVASAALNVVLWFSRERTAVAWRVRALEAEDAKKAQELRSARQIDAMLDRVRTSDRLEIAAPAPLPVSPDVKRYSPDYEGDFDWNEFQGEPDAAEVQEGQNVT